MILDLAVYIAAWAIGIGVICWLDARRDRAAAKAQHPAWSDATEAAIEQAVGVVDDGRALVRETEAFLEGRSR
jgi:hypothetical protein